MNTRPDWRFRPGSRWSVQLTRAGGGFRDSYTADPTVYALELCLALAEGARGAAVAVHVYIGPARVETLFRAHHDGTRWCAGATS